MLKIAICDDNVSVCLEIKEMIADYAKRCAVKFGIEVFTAGEELIDFIKRDHDFDLIFLDIELGAATGIEIGSRIRCELNDYISKIVFISSKDGYDRQLFEVQPLYFIPKPVDESKVVHCINLAIKLLGISDTTFEYKKGTTAVKVDVKDIIYFESRKKLVKIVTKNGENSFYSTLENVKQKMPRTFIQPHGSFLINFDNVRRTTKDKAVMINGTEIPISQRYHKNIRDMLIGAEREKKK